MFSHKRNIPVEKCPSFRDGLCIKEVDQVPKRAYNGDVDSVLMCYGERNSTSLGSISLSDTCSVKLEVRFPQKISDSN